MKAAYHLGCPVWASDRWLGTLFTHKAARNDWLRQYASVFNAVEGNSTFYGIPARETVERWADSVNPGFQFALKFPRTITHEKRLIKAAAETREFLDVLSILASRRCLGPSLLQLPASFSGHQLKDLTAYIKALRDWPLAVEVRHRDFFGNSTHARELNQLLVEWRIDRVILDSRPLFSAPADTKYEEMAQSRKPQLPVEWTLTARRPMVRLIGRDETRRVRPWLVEWARILSKWIRGGLEPLVFLHTPDERYAPQLAREFHRELCRYTELVADLPAWPGEVEQHGVRQLKLF